MRVCTCLPCPSIYLPNPSDLSDTPYLPSDLSDRPTYLPQTTDPFWRPTTEQEKEVTSLQHPTNLTYPAYLTYPLTPSISTNTLGLGRGGNGA